MNVPPKQIGYVFTNFNNSSFTRKAVESIAATSEWENSLIVIVDNNSVAKEVEFLEGIKTNFPCIHIILNPENVGYFSGLNLGIKYLREHFDSLDCIVIGNNDLVFPVDFADKIHANWDSICQYPVISPDLVDLDGVHQNPHVIAQISVFREAVWDLYFLNFRIAQLLAYCAKLLKRFVERKDYTQHQIAGPIYQGYGACYILGPRFFENFELLWAPTFLMGEEFFLSKQLESKNFSVYYEPQIVVTHLDHASLGTLPSRKLWEITRDSHKVYKTFVKPPQLFWRK